jgi:hypothetical protein
MSASSGGPRCQPGILEPELADASETSICHQEDFLSARVTLQQLELADGPALTATITSSYRSSGCHKPFRYQIQSFITAAPTQSGAPMALLQQGYEDCTPVKPSKLGAYQACGESTTRCQGPSPPELARQRSWTRPISADRGAGSSWLNS